MSNDTLNSVGKWKTKKLTPRQIYTAISSLRGQMLFSSSFTPVATTNFTLCNKQMAPATTTEHNNPQTSSDKLPIRHPWMLFIQRQHVTWESIPRAREVRSINTRDTSIWLRVEIPVRYTISYCFTSPWCSGKCVRFGAGRSRGRLLAGSYQDLVNWYCSLLTRRTVYGRAAGNTPRTQNQPSETEPRNCTISVLALQDHCSYKAPTTNHHIKELLLPDVERGGDRRLPHHPNLWLQTLNRWAKIVMAA